MTAVKKKETYYLGSIFVFFITFIFGFTCNVPNYWSKKKIEIFFKKQHFFYRLKNIKILGGFSFRF